jgi:hypothetical protein
MLKPFEQMTDPDGRYRTMSGITGLAPITSAEHHDWVAAITLEASVPAPIVEAFDRARDAFVYSWFVYELASLAEAQAYFTLELALRHRLGFGPGLKAPMLHQLLKDAVAQGILKDDGDHAGPSLVFIIPKLRNNWAHGSIDLNGPAISIQVLTMCADLINQAFQ